MKLREMRLPHFLWLTPRRGRLDAGHAAALVGQTMRAVFGVMRDHGYNIGSDAVLMYHGLSKYYDRVFADPGLACDLKALEPNGRARHYRTKGLQLVRLS